MLIYEHRVVMPLSVEEYRLAQLYSLTDATKLETGGGEGFEIVVNEPFTSAPRPLICNGVEYTTGQYTHKILYLNSKLPYTIRTLAPKGSTEIHEKSWNAYPYVRTEYSNPDYMKENFVMTIETMHLNDAGTTDNVHNVSADLLQKRMVWGLDIVNDPVSSADYREDEDPTKFTSAKTGRGPLTSNWKDVSGPMMCAYKLVTVNFNWFGLQDKIENTIQRNERQVFTKFHRQMYCWMDRWYGLSLEDIRKIEEKTKLELNQLRQSGVVTGMVAP